MCNPRSCLMPWWCILSMRQLEGGESQLKWLDLRVVLIIPSPWDLITAARCTLRIHFTNGGDIIVTNEFPHAQNGFSDHMTTPSLMFRYGAFNESHVSQLINEIYCSKLNNWNQGAQLYTMNLFLCMNFYM